ncbi:MAG: protein jag [Clostridia bacterium]|nr:protein jag [Clostridia bacterium]
MKETVKKGKTVEEAVSLALEELGISEEDAEIEIIDEGNKGLFGLIGNKEAEVRVSAKEMSYKDEVYNFLKELLSKMKIEAEIEIDDTQKGFRINLSGSNMGILIGRRGETLMALQYLTSLMINRKSEEYISVTIDTENYKKKREETLINLAKKTSNKAVKYKRNMTLDPMNPYERRIIHSSLQGDDRVKTYSTGEEPNRRVVIAYNRDYKN